MFVRILGIDPGLTRCGFGVVLRHNDRRIEFSRVGIFTTSAQVKVSERLAEIHHDIAELLDEIQPDVIAIERVLFQNNANTAMSVAQVSGLVHSLAASRAIEVFEYSPNEVKNVVTGDGRADKQAVSSMVTKLLGLNKVPQPADASDALAIAITHAFAISLNSQTSSDSSDSAIYNGSKLHNAIAEAIAQHSTNTKTIPGKQTIRRSENERELDREQYEKGILEYEPQWKYRTRRRGFSR